MVEFVLNFIKKYSFTTKVYDILTYVYRKIFVRKINESILNNKERYSEYDIPLNWFYEKKPRGLSGVARLKNAEHFLELCLESHIPFLDELILVDNNSTDNTKEICKKFLKKYPHKVKYFEYPFDVKPYSSDNSNLTSNSVHSLAYYYNRAFSKSKYSHVMKVDDDNLLIKDKRESIREIALNSKKYNVYYGINLAKDKNGRFGIVKSCIHLGYFGDHGIYPVTPYTYYLQGKKWEIFINNLPFKRHGFALLHLKFLKPLFGFHNLNLSKKELDSNNKFFENQNEYIYDIKKYVGDTNLTEYTNLLNIIE